MLIGRLRGRGHTLALAESCTGGLIGAAITAVPGASKVLWGGLISYDDAAKRALLGISEASLRGHGAVSRTVAEEMAAGARRVSGTTWSLAVTGIAGPSGGTPDKPVGTVWIAHDGPSRDARRYSFDGGREAIREAAAIEAMRLLVSCVERT
ncbi:CinA family protein [Candidatus Palauibacter sp.]|uniref:CinA family protein n=1 Tax=Candidatus Palauibacter sp. TaxID=3101350 RepID=UPI003B02DC85